MLKKHDFRDKRFGDSDLLRKCVNEFLPVQYRVCTFHISHAILVNFDVGGLRTVFNSIYGFRENRYSESDAFNRRVNKIWPIFS
jgi:hypothetical protein